MLSLIDRLKFVLGLTLVVLLCLSGWAQDDKEAIQWDADWVEILSSEDSSDTEKHLQLTNLLLEWGDTVGWASGENWDRAAELLSAWEASPDIETARVNYLKILDTIGWNILESGRIQLNEQQLREFYSRATRISRNPEEEGKLLFHMAASLYRSEQDSVETRRRIVAYLEQASLAVGVNPLAGNIHFLLGIIYKEWGKSGGFGLREETSYYPQAVFHLQHSLSIPGIDPEIRIRAEATLEELLLSGLELNVENRYHPEDAIRITVASRNISQLEVSLIPVPWEINGMPVKLSSLDSFDVEGIDPVLEKSVRINMENRVDWQDTEILLGGGVAGGWYMLQVSGGGVRRQSLMLVTGIEVVVIPRSDKSMTLWVVDSVTGLPVESAEYFVLNSQGNPLYIGTSDLNGMAEIVAGFDTTWAEVHVRNASNPAVIRNSDLDETIHTSPWIIPDTVNVYPGERLSWVLVDDSPADEELSTDSLILLPEGAGLIPQRDQTASKQKYFVDIPEVVDDYGPIYLSLPNGKGVLVSHLDREQPLPLSIELSGEQFSPDKHLFVSSTPVGVRIFQDNSDQSEIPGYIRVTVEELNRPASYTDIKSVSKASSEVVFEHITRLGDSDVREAYLELPELQQSVDPVPLRIRTYPLDSDRLLAESYLAIVPYRAKVELVSSEQVINVGESITIQISKVQRGLSLTHSLTGDLVAYRENWENRYIHRKKGTPLSEDEYNSLPERSMLGTAKTDYRLLERGLVREEVLRSRISPSEKFSIPINFERHGHYRIEFQATDDILAQYPEGIIEVWVLPESGELDAFRSEQPRLIVEKTKSGDEEILILMDRSDASILLDLKTRDGESETGIIKPNSSGYYLVRSADEPPLDLCRAVISGDRRTDFLCQHLATETQAVWEVWMDQMNGLNPGSEFNWKVSLVNGDFGEQPIWGIYPESEGELAENCLLIQQLIHQKNSKGCDLGAVALANWLPLFQPIGGGLSEEQVNLDQGIKLSDINLLVALYPELQESSNRKGGFVEFDYFTLDDNDPAYALTGTLPLSAGRWCLTSFSPDDHQSISMRSWPFSTELPIRTATDGPAVMRKGDRALAELTAENTTRRALTVEVLSVVEGSIANSEQVPVEVQLPPGQSIELPVQMDAIEGGEGRMTISVQDAQSSSIAFVETTVHERKPVPVLKSYFAQKGSGQWEETISLAGLDSGQILISSGIGDHLVAIWPILMEDYLGKEPLLAHLTDWAMEKVAYHHGLGGEDSSQKANTLKNSLSVYTVESGISWTQGNSFDPWLTALVSWGIETFANLSEEALSDQQAQLLNHLEAALIDETNSTEARIFALRTLSARAIHDPRIRPSRIQAKSFLEFFHGREQLTPVQVAMLMDVALAYRFNQEVRMLAQFLSDRLNSSEAIESLSLWETSLVYLAMSLVPNSNELLDLSLKSILDKIDLIANQPGWEQMGSFMNLLAVFLWEGDFSVDGEVNVMIGNTEPISLSLKPHGENKGHLILRKDDLPTNSEFLSLKLDTSLSYQPVLVTLVGTTDIHPKLPDYPRQDLKVSREFVEHTLLAGSHVHSIDSDLGSTFYPDDTLLLKISLEVEESESYAEFTFNIPAGVSLSVEEIGHTVVAASSEGIFNNPIISLRPRGNPLEQKVRIEPLSKGKHEFTLPYQIKWGGSYSFPPHEVKYPKSGQSFLIGGDSTVEIQPSSE